MRVLVGQQKRKHVRGESRGAGGRVSCLALFFSPLVARVWAWDLGSEGRTDGGNVRLCV